MPSRVSPNKTAIHGDQEVSTSANDASFVVNIQEQENDNEQPLKEIDDIYRPVLKLMTLFGIYVGKPSLKCLASNSGEGKKLSVVSIIHCFVVTSGLWLNAIMAFTEIFFEDDIYMFLMFSFWNVFVAIIGTMNLLLLRLTGNKKSRFEQFLVNVLSVTKHVNLEQVKAKSKKGVIMFCFFVLTLPAIIVAFELLLDINIGTFYPWNRWSGFRILFATFLTIGFAVWLLPVIFLWITSLLLESCIDNLHKGMSPLHSIAVDLTTSKQEYHKLCEVVKLADKMLAPLLFAYISVYIPLLCFGFYNVVNLPEEDSLTFLVFNLSSLLLAAFILAVILLFGSKVSEKVLHGYLKE